MYNMSMLRHRFLNERWGEGFLNERGHQFLNERWGGGGALNHLPLLFCESV